MDVDNDLEDQADGGWNARRSGLGIAEVQVQKRNKFSDEEELGQDYREDRGADKE